MPDYEESLFISCKEGNFNAIKTLIENGVDINAEDSYGSTPLHEATYYNRLEIVQFLLNNGADINSFDRYGNTALTWSRTKGWTSIENLLIDKGAKQ